MRKFLLVLLLLSAGYRAGAQVTMPLKAHLDKVSLTVAMGLESHPSYAVFYGTKPVIKPSRLGLSFADGKGFDGPMVLVGSETKDVDETWQPVWGLLRGQARNMPMVSMFSLRNRPEPSQKITLTPLAC